MKRLMLFVGFVVSVCGFTETARAALIQVDTTSNVENDDNVCVLVEAVTAINNNAPYMGCEGGSGYDGIRLPSGTINSGSIWLFNPATIQGNGLTASFINFTSSGTGCGLSVSAGVSLTNLTLQQGPGFSVAGICGFDGSVALNGARVRSFQNGGIAMFGGVLSGINVRIENNHSYGDGGGIWVDTNATMARIERSSITNNAAPNGRGGGLAFYGLGYGNPTLENCTISGNQAYEGGGIFSNAPDYLDVQRCTIVSNTANKGGGISSLPTDDAYMRISESMIVSNSANSGANFYGPPGADFPNFPPDAQSANAEYNLWGGPFDEYQTGIVAGPGDESYVQASIGGESTGLSNTGFPYYVAMYPLRSTAISLNKIPCGPGGSVTDIRGVARPRGPACDKGSHER